MLNKTNKFSDSYRDLINSYSRKNGNVEVYNDKGQLTNWNELSKLSKEDYIEDTYDSLDYSKSKYPGLALLNKVGWAGLSELNRKRDNHDK